ncbi:TRAP transporter substrate-binding protein [Rhodobacteraceae bacterium RKSG542]|nr:TRAP transporter substrate-binding protein [Pseudovibrio flavus]
MLKAAIIAGVMSAIPLTASAQTILRLAENQPEDNAVTIAMHKFAELVKQKTNGEVLVDVYSGGQLGQEVETIEQAQAGIIDFARVNTVPLANVSPSMGVVTLPYIFKDADHKYQVLDSEIGKTVRTDLEQFGLIGFDFMEAGTRNFYTRSDKPINSIEDLKGLKIRVQPAPISIRMTELLGATPTPMNYGEVFSALQSGVIDGAENDYVSYLTSSHYEVANVIVEDGHLSPPAILLMNKARFDTLPAEQQTAISEAAREAALFEREAMFEGNRVAKEKVIEAGVKVITIDNTPFQEAVMPLYSEYPHLNDLVEDIIAFKTK